MATGEEITTRQTVEDRSRLGPGDGGPIQLLAVLTALAVVGSVVWALVLGR